MFRLIRKDELDPAARILAKAFHDYPLYRIYFPEENYDECMYYSFLYLLIVSRHFTYVSDDLSLIACVQKPDSKGGNPLSILFHPIFCIKYLMHIPIESYISLIDYTLFAAPIERRVRRPEDWCIHALCTTKEGRESRILFDFFREFDEGASVYCDTHTAQNVKLYEHFGAKVCAESDWHGVHHYVMRREAVTNDKGSGKIIR